MVCKGIEWFIASGGAAGQQVPHFMIHLVPRDDDDGLSNFDLKTGMVTEEQQKEIQFSHKRITEEMGDDCKLFAYPNGKNSDYNQNTIEFLKELGYIGAVTTVFGYVKNNDQNCFQLNRFGTEVPPEEIGAIVTGLSHVVGKA